MERKKKKKYILVLILLLVLTALVFEIGRKHWDDMLSYGNKIVARFRPLAVTVASPTAGEAEVSTNRALFVFFSKALDPSTLNDSSIVLKNESTQLPAKVTYLPAEFCVRIEPDFPLQVGKSYTLTLRGGEGINKIRDTAGKVLPKDTSWGFTTASPKELSDPANGPGGPILVLSSGSNGFSRFPVEILRAEGWNAFNAMDISAINSEEMAKYDVIILGDMTLKTEMVNLLSKWVNSGGTLIAFHPDHQLANLFGIAPTGKSIS
jgi:Big-like domain-containing protein